MVHRALTKSKRNYWKVAETLDEHQKHDAEKRFYLIDLYEAGVERNDKKVMKVMQILQDDYEMDDNAIKTSMRGKSPIKLSDEKLEEAFGDLPLKKIRVVEKRMYQDEDTIDYIMTFY